MEYVVSFFLMLMWCVGIYNMGYILASRILGFEVTEFSIGFGPRLVEFTLGNTTYGLKAIPLGGFVKIAEHETNLKYLLLICAGPLAVILLSFFATGLLLYTGYDVIKPRGAIVVEAPASGTAASLQKGDVITEAGGQTVRDAVDAVRHLDDWKSGDLTLTLRRGELSHSVTLTRTLLGDGQKLERLGIVVRSMTENRRMGLVHAIWNAPVYHIKYMAGGLASVWLNWGPGRQQALDSRQHPTFGYLQMLGFLAFYFGLFNMLPLPVLVGGEALFVAVTLLIGRPLDNVLVERLQQIGFVFLLLMMSFIIFTDLYSCAVPPDRNSYTPRSKSTLSVIQWSQYNVPLSA